MVRLGKARGLLMHDGSRLPPLPPNELGLNCYKRIDGEEKDLPNA